MGKRAYRPIPLFAVAVLLNYLWELVQAPLYVGLESYSTTVLWRCFVASLGDGLMVLLIVAAGWITLRRWDWFEQPAVVGYVRYGDCGVGDGGVDRVVGSARLEAMGV